METPGQNAVPVYTRTRDDVYMKEDNYKQHEKDLCVLTGVKQKHDHEVEVTSAFHVLRLASPATTQV